MKYLTKKHTAFLIFGCWLVYVAAYVGRLNYSASMVKIIAELNITNDKGGLVYSCFALAYGVGQLVNGLLCRYYNPKYVITGALGVSAAVNLLMPFGEDYRVMAALWLINGIVQSMLYSLIIRTISRNVKSGSISRAIYAMSTTVAIGTALAYGISAGCVALDCWQITFFVAAVVLILAACVWVWVMTTVERAKAAGDLEEDDAPAQAPTEHGVSLRKSRLFLSMLVLIGTTAIANGFIKDGVNNWLPKLLHDEYGVADSLSIILTLLLPAFSVLGAVFARKVYLKLRNHLLINGIFYGTAFVLALGVYLFYPIRNVPLTMVLFIGLACMMAAVNNVITSMFPLDNRDKMDSGLLAGLLDTLCYVGSTAAGTLLGVLSQTWSWESVLITLTALAGVAALLSISFSFSVKKKK